MNVMLSHVLSRSHDAAQNLMGMLCGGFHAEALAKSAEGGGGHGVPVLGRLQQADGLAHHYRRIVCDHT
ncbi:MAG: hypothetical protein AAFX07_17760, partial [Pseudomonadota bacterium]